MKEDNAEYLQAVQENDLTETANRLSDVPYILDETIIEHRLQDKIEIVFVEIDRSNRSNLNKNDQHIFSED